VVVAVCWQGGLKPQEPVVVSLLEVIDDDTVGPGMSVSGALEGVVSKRRWKRWLTATTMRSCMCLHGVQRTGVVPLMAIIVVIARAVGEVGDDDEVVVKGDMEARWRAMRR